MKKNELIEKIEKLEERINTQSEIRQLMMNKIDEQAKEIKELKGLLNDKINEDDKKMSDFFNLYRKDNRNVWFDEKGNTLKFFFGNEIRDITKEKIITEICRICELTKSVVNARLKNTIWYLVEEDAESLFINIKEFGGVELFYLILDKKLLNLKIVDKTRIRELDKKANSQSKVIE